MTYEDVLDFLYKSLPMFQRQGAVAFNKSLDKTLQLLKELDNPHEKINTIHIAGTNGKGTTSHMLAAILQTAGYKTGLYTSPHLKNFTERIRVDGQEVDRDFVVSFVTENKSLIDSINPSFFELTVAMSFAYFAKKNVDIAVIETGMGGKWDSTNVITPLLSIITNISWDHQQYLGDTLEKIAGEKAGIIKKEVPVIIGEYQPEVFHVFEEVAASNNAPLLKGNEIEINGNNGCFDVLFKGKLLFEGLSVEFKGAYVLKNIPAVIRAVQLLRNKELYSNNGFEIADENIVVGLRETISQTGLKGRWQEISQTPKVICDTGHNYEGVKLNMEQLKLIERQNLFIIWGAVSDKDISEVLKLLPKEAQYVFSEPSIPRKMIAEELAEKAKICGIKGKVIKDVNEALAYCRSVAGPEDIIFVGGSTFLIADVKEL